MFQGGRMGFGSVTMLVTGVWGKEDLPRYQFQKIRVEEEAEARED